MKTIINIFDGNFRGGASSVAWKTPELIEYVDQQTNFDGVTFFTDEYVNNPIVDVVQSKYKIGWLHEPFCLHPYTYENARNNMHKFDAVLTYYQPFLDEFPNAVFCPYAGVWIPREHWGFHNKTKDVSMLIGGKMSTDGHRLRHKIAALINQNNIHVDFFGVMGEAVDYSWQTKERVLSEYRFSIVTETCREDNEFTEWLLDCFAVGTIPVFWGCPNIDEFFDGAGVISFEKAQEVIDVLPYLDDNLYKRLLPFACNNLELVKDYEITEDWIYKNVLEGSMHNVNGYVIDEDTAPALIDNVAELYFKYFGFPYKGTFVEVGGMDGISWSFTNCLAEAGWKGLYIEPQPKEADSCRHLYRNNPKIIVEQCAAGSHHDTVKLYMGGSLSTVRKDMIPVANKVVNALKEDRFIMVEMHTLDNILVRNYVKKNFDLLVIDVEGAEYDVLRGFTIGRWKPKMCIVEACDPCPDPILSQRTFLVRDYFTKYNYIEIVSSGNDIVFVRKLL